MLTSAFTFKSIGTKPYDSRISKLSIFTISFPKLSQCFYFAYFHILTMYLKGSFLELLDYSIRCEMLGMSSKHSATLSNFMQTPLIRDLDSLRGCI